MSGCRNGFDPLKLKMNWLTLDGINKTSVTVEIHNANCM